jgi:hypothetical protein
MTKQATIQEQEMLMDMITDDAKFINLLDVIDERYDEVHKITYADNKASKAAKEYQKEEEAKLLFMQDVLKRSVRQAYDEQEVYILTDQYHRMRDNFDIMVYVKKKQVS